MLGGQEEWVNSALKRVRIWDQAGGYKLKAKS